MSYFVVTLYSFVNITFVTNSRNKIVTISLSRSSDQFTLRICNGLWINKCKWTAKRERLRFCESFENLFRWCNTIQGELEDDRGESFLDSFFPEVSKSPSVLFLFHGRIIFFFFFCFSHSSFTSIVIKTFERSAIEMHGGRRVKIDECRKIVGATYSLRVILRATAFQCDPSQSRMNHASLRRTGTSEDRTLSQTRANPLN